MPTLNVLFGTESGNSEKLASSIELTAKEITKIAGDKAKFDVVRKNLKDVKVDDLASMENIIVVISTWGEGDPPGSCEKFCKDLFKASSPSLAGKNYAVLAMGDKSYADFCGCGRRVDEALAKLGASSILARKDFDLDFAAHYENWAVELFTNLTPKLV
ncbi:MAG: flavodoxin domain-containing protein [Candidatus Caenarcaniphilales bacterium]|jgi:sulfite reductase (NADPH) flavoprotein alpha-component|nr:flavodoxin domain-containing protein [Candidatus Caenarcaniphilales bacterium]